MWENKINLFCLKASESSVSEFICDVYSNQIQGGEKIKYSNKILIVKIISSKMNPENLTEAILLSLFVKVGDERKKRACKPH